MAEHIRDVVVTIEVDTNKNTYKRRLIWDDNIETREEFERRGVKAISSLTELS